MTGQISRGWKNLILGTLLLVAILTAVFGIAWANWITDAQDFDSEALRARDANCRLFEAEHLRDVEGLSNTYEYLLTLSAKERATGINKYIIARLPETEMRAKTDAAPEYCDHDDLGLPEPDPVIPERPKQFR